MKKLFVLLILLAFAGVALADINWESASCNEIALQETTFDLTQLVNSEKAFWFVDGETVNLTVFRQGPPFEMSGKVKNRLVTEFRCEHREDATIGVYIQRDAIVRMYNAQNQVAELVKLKEEGGIKVEPYSLGAIAKVRGAELLLWFADALGLKNFI